MQPKKIDKLLPEYRSAVLLLILLDSMVIKNAKKHGRPAFSGLLIFCKFEHFFKTKINNEVYSFLWDKLISTLQGACPKHFSPKRCFEFFFLTGFWTFKDLANFCLFVYIPKQTPRVMKISTNDHWTFLFPTKKTATL